VGTALARRQCHPTRHSSGLGLAGLAILLAWAPAQAEDWPTYQHDPARSATTKERLAPPLAESWVFQPRQAPEPAWGPPKAGPVEGILELRRSHFDDAPQVSVAQGAVYFGSSANGKVYCLDAATGRVRWTYPTAGPVRLSPTLDAGRVFVGSDDGYAYCLDAQTGSLRWRFRAAPEDKRVLGNGRMISLWPLRAGVLVDAGVAYLAAGVFPAEGVFFYALDAESGKVLWKNDSGGEAPQSTISPQGYLLASKTTLYAPMGRVSPAALDRSDGKLKHLTYFGKQIGGTYALVADDEEVYTGTEMLVGYRGQTRDRFANYPGSKIVVAKDTVYLAGKTLSALDRKAYPPASRKLESAVARVVQATASQVEAARKAKKPAPKADDEQMKAAKEEVRKAQAELARTIRWEAACPLDDALILAGDVLLAGGSGEVQAVEAASGKPLWSAKVDGAAKGLAAAAGRLLVSTDQGKIYCFGPEGTAAHGTVAEPVVAEPYKDSPLSARFRQAAETILSQSGVRAGYCLVVDCQTGELALELARRSELVIYAVSPDAEKVAAARKALDAAGVYGSRVLVEQWPADKVPYADYFANLLVSEGAVAQGTLPAAPAELVRMLKPCGGVALLGEPQADRAAGAGPLEEAVLRRWLAESKQQGGEIVTQGGRWLKMVRGPIPGAGGWTHQYANPANTSCGDDQALRCPLEVLWFGQPGPGMMVNRHLRAAAPLATDGRLFVQGENVLAAYDAYNGLKLWERLMLGAFRTNASRDTSNLAVGAQGLLVALEGRCLRLDPATGRTLATYEVPAADDGKPRRWALVACADGLLIGSRSAAVARPWESPWSALISSDAVFAVDLRSGKRLWVYQGKQVPHNTISLADGKVFFVDGDVVALDARTGDVRWRQAVDLSFIGRGGSISSMAHNGVLLLFGVYTDGHYWQEFFAGQFAGRKIVALAADTGKLLWSKPLGYRVRPIVIGDVLHAEPWAFDLKTGEPKTRIHPITGQADRWQFARPGHHCGNPIGSPNCLIFRSLCLGYYDLVRDSGTMHFGAQRPGCWINAVPACGLLLMPEASAGCMCAFPNMCSVAFKPGQSGHAYAYYSAPGPMLPVQRLAIHFGAAGDRQDAAGQLWLGYPRPKGSLVLPLDLKVALLPGGSYRQRSSRYSEVTGTEEGWLFSSAAVGLGKCTIPLLGKDDPPATYRVRLALADPDNAEPGRRVFDVKLQDKLVAEGLDVAQAAGGRNRAMFKEFSGVRVARDLTIELVPKIPKPTTQQAPILQAIEIVRQALR
jgi:outer membrane protein assembly factor BamB